MLLATVPNSCACVSTHIRMRIVNVPSRIIVTVPLMASPFLREHHEQPDARDNENNESESHCETVQLEEFIARPIRHFHTHRRTRRRRDVRLLARLKHDAHFAIEVIRRHAISKSTSPSQENATVLDGPPLAMEPGALPATGTTDP